MAGHVACALPILKRDTVDLSWACSLQVLSYSSECNIYLVSTMCVFAEDIMSQETTYVMKAKLN